MDTYFEEHKPLADHAGRSLRGGAISIAARAISAFVQIGSVLFLARLLSPEDYGLISMVTAFTGFAPVLVDLGTRDAIVQRASISRGEASALFWLTLGIGSAVTVLAAASGPFIARFYGEPRLTMIVLVSSLTFVACALSVQHHALLRRVMRFEDLARVEVGAGLLSACAAIATALAGAGYWALLVRPIVGPVLVAIGVWLKCPWRPGRPTLTQDVKENVKFGLNLTGFTMTDFAGRSADRVAIGYRIGASGLGQYQNAMFVYDNLLDVLVFPLHGVAVASLSKLRYDLTALRAAWAKALSTLAFFAMPAFGLLAVTSQDLIVLVLGEKWAGAGALVSVLAFRGIPQCIERTLGWLHVTAGRTDRWMRWGLFATALHGVALVIGLPYGPMGVATAYVIVMFLLFVPAVAYAGAPLDIHTKDVISQVWRQLLASLAAAGLAFLLRWTLLADLHALARTTVLGLTYSLLYLVIAMGILNVRGPVNTTRQLVRSYLGPRLAQLFR